MATHRLSLTLLALACALATPALAQVPEGGTAGKVDRSKSLKPLDIRRKPVAIPREKMESEIPDVTAIPRPTVAPPTKPSVVSKPPAPKPPTLETPEERKGVAMDIKIEPAAKPALRKGFLIESTVVNPKVFFPIKGGEKTVLAAAYEWDYGVKTYTKDDWADVDAKTFAKESIALADELLDTVEPRFVRDYRDVIEYAIINSEDPFISSILISKKFIDRFSDTIGDDIHAIVLDRRTIYLFPAGGGALNSYAGALIEQYADALEPVSLEVFSISRTGYEIVGNVTP